MARGCPSLVAVSFTTVVATTSTVVTSSSFLRGRGEVAAKLMMDIGRHHDTSSRPVSRLALQAASGNALVLDPIKVRARGFDSGSNRPGVLPALFYIKFGLCLKL